MSKAPKRTAFMVVGLGFGTLLGGKQALAQSNLAPQPTTTTTFDYIEPAHVDQGPDVAERPADVPSPVAESTPPAHVDQGSDALEQPADTTPTTFVYVPPAHAADGPDVVEQPAAVATDSDVAEPDDRLAPRTSPIEITPEDGAGSLTEESDFTAANTEGLLPDTGSDLAPVVLAGGALLAVGGLTSALVMRRRASRSK